MATVGAAERPQEHRFYSDVHAVREFGDVLRSHEYIADGMASLPYVEEALELIKLGTEATFEVDFEHLSVSARRHIVRHYDRFVGHRLASESISVCRVYPSLVDELNSFVREVDLQNNHPPSQHLLAHFLKLVNGVVKTFR
eukprot:GHVS01077207.1.p1 GENE.GHVS01077207.1~~GHVS01077207.1.p1  ORF type:complete len:141 (+),score=25.47 GHVS01077207.1:72-494(+)